MPDWTPDPVVGRFIPDPELLARVQRHQMKLWADESPTFNHVRQQWENSMGATRVAMDSLRDVWPLDREVVNPGTWEEMQHALHHIQEAFMALDRCRGEFESEPVRLVSIGAIRDHKSLDIWDVPR